MPRRDLSRAVMRMLWLKRTPLICAILTNGFLSRQTLWYVSKDKNKNDSGLASGFLNYLLWLSPSFWKIATIYSNRVRTSCKRLWTPGMVGWVHPFLLWYRITSYGKAFGKQLSPKMATVGILFIWYNYSVKIWRKKNVDLDTKINCRYC